MSAVIKKSSPNDDVCRKAMTYVKFADKPGKQGTQEERELEEE